MYPSLRYIRAPSTFSKQLTEAELLAWQQHMHDIRRPKH